MKKSICGIDCDACFMKDKCRGCVETLGCPFGKECVCAYALRSDPDGLMKLKADLLTELHSLGIPELSEVADLNALKGSFINLSFLLPGGDVVRFFDDDKIYLGTQVEKKDGHCIGVAADEKHLLVCEYGTDGTNPELLLFKKWNGRTNV